jgi:hypothetical protein
MAVHRRTGTVAGAVFAATIQDAGITPVTAPARRRITDVLRRVRGMHNVIFSASLRSGAVRIKTRFKHGWIASSRRSSQRGGEMSAGPRPIVMAGLDPAIHVLPTAPKGVDARVTGGAKRRRSSNGYVRA